jgi:hypothetical protein
VPQPTSPKELALHGREFIGTSDLSAPFRAWAISLKKNFTPAIISDLPILRMRRTIDLDDEPCFPAQEINNIGTEGDRDRGSLPNELEFL